MTRYARLLLLIAVCISCKPSPQQQPAKTAAPPQVRATVISVRTTVEPEKKTHEHAIVVAGDRARHTGENDRWRLFDLKAQTVTFVDDVEKTIRTEPLAALVRRRATFNANALPPHYPPAKLVRTNETKAMHGAAARKVVILSGAYRRELWLGEHPRIPRGLFAMMHASDTPSSPLGPIMRAVDAALVNERGFPLSDRTEVPLGKDKLVVERTVTGVAEREVPEALLKLPDGYKDLTPKPQTQ